MSSPKILAAAGLSLCALTALAGAPVLAQAQQRPAQAGSADGGAMQRADKDMRQVLQKLQELGAKPIGTASVEETRKAPTPADAVKAILKEQGRDPDKLAAATGVTKREIAYNAPQGDLPARVYTPAGQAPQGGWPIVLYFHGGGWVIADLDTYEASAMALAK